MSYDGEPIEVGLEAIKEMLAMAHAVEGMNDDEVDYDEWWVPVAQGRLIAAYLIQMPWIVAQIEREREAAQRHRIKFVQESQAIDALITALDEADMGCYACASQSIGSENQCDCGNYEIRKAHEALRALREKRR